MVNPQKFVQEAESVGILGAFKKHYPQLEANDRGTHERLNKYAAMRQRFIAYVQKTENVAFSEAESIVDAGNSPNRL